VNESETAKLIASVHRKVGTDETFHADYQELFKKLRDRSLFVKDYSLHHLLHLVSFSTLDDSDCEIISAKEASNAAEENESTNFIEKVVSRKMQSLSLKDRLRHTHSSEPLNPKVKAVLDHWSLMMKHGKYGTLQAEMEDKLKDPLWQQYKEHLEFKLKEVNCKKQLGYK
jgi:hypothetical protein